ncbi:MAG: hypothetical protein ABWY63_01720 [Hyphomicrobiaceae bacterium]
MASVFSGKAGRNAAVWTANQAVNQRTDLDQVALQGYRAQKQPVQQGFTQGLKALQGGYTGARDFTTQGYGQGIDTLRQTQGQQLAALSGQYGTAQGQLSQGYEQARGAWQPFHDQSMAGYQMYQNALGLGGAEGTAAAQNAFQTGPGYQWNVDQGVEQTARAANKYGALYGGNTNDATTRLASNLANQEYDKWRQNLSGFMGAAQTSSGALADIYGQEGRGLAELSADLGRQQSGVYGTTGTNIANAQIGQGTALAGLRSDYGANQAGLQVARGQSMGGLAGQYYGNIANNVNQQYGTVIPAGQQGMMAGQQAAANKVGAILGGAQLGAQLLGGGMGGGSKGFLSGLGFGK